MLRTPLNGLPYPALGDPPDVRSDLARLALALDPLVGGDGGGGGADLEYNGAYPTNSPYTDGDIVVYNGVPYICVRPTSAPPTPWPGVVYRPPTYGSSPPPSPVDGDEWVMPLASGGVWEFRYNAASGTYPWEFIGGTPLLGLASEGKFPVANSWTPITPNVVVPRSGSYIFESAAYETHGQAGQYSQGPGLTTDAFPPIRSYGTTALTGYVPLIPARDPARALVAGTTVCIFIHTTVSSTSWYARGLMLTPVRVA